MKQLWWLSLWACIAQTMSVHGGLPEHPTRGDRMLAEYFRAQTALLRRRCLAEVQTAIDWQARRERLREQLLDMMGLKPLPPRGELRPVITGRLEGDGFRVEKLHFQSLPGLYVTANLYLPKEVSEPLPAILYACGHGRVVTNGISCGNKTHYQHHGIWFARHGYVCLLIDTVQLGEIEGMHHGTYRYGQWWWNSRGYTPAGVEAWNCMRALDYLETRPEVDRTRIGMTGRSGGGAYTWFTAALDDRVKVAAPVAGITDLENHVVDGTVEGHCDCMFFVNTYGWDYPLLAALVAPRPLLFCNSDKDRIFPLDGVLRTHAHLQRLYALLGAADKLGLLITEGPHRDTQDLRVPVFRWFDRFLKEQDTLVDEPAKPAFSPLELRVFDKLPEDEINTTVQDVFIPRADVHGPARPTALRAQLRQRTFRGWPRQSGPHHARRVFSVTRKGVQFAAWDFESQPSIELRLYVAQRADAPKPGRIHVQPADQETFEKLLRVAGPNLKEELSEELRMAGIDLATVDTASARQAFAGWCDAVVGTDTAYVVVAPRTVGLTALSAEQRYRTHVRRRFMLLGQTLAGMQVWDVWQALKTLSEVGLWTGQELELEGEGAMAAHCLLTALFEPGVTRLLLHDLPLDEKEAPDYLNLTRFTSLSQVLETVSQQVGVQQP